MNGQMDESHSVGLQSRHRRGWRPAHTLTCFPRVPYTRAHTSVHACAMFPPAVHTPMHLCTRLFQNRFPESCELRFWPEPLQLGATPPLPLREGLWPGLPQLGGPRAVTSSSWASLSSICESELRSPPTPLTSQGGLSVPVRDGGGKCSINCTLLPGWPGRWRLRFPLLG